MQRSISTLMTELQKVLDAHGDLNVEIEAEKRALDGVYHKIQAKAHTVIVELNDLEKHVCVVSSNDGQE